MRLSLLRCERLTLQAPVLEKGMMIAPPATDRDSLKLALPMSLPTGLAIDSVVPRIDFVDGEGSGHSWRYSLVAAIALHAAVIAGFSYNFADAMAGAGGTDLEAISVDVISASAIDVMAPVSNPAESQAAGRLAEREGSEREQAEARQTPDNKRVPVQDRPTKPETADPVIPDVAVKLEPPVPDVPSIVIVKAADEKPVESPENRADKNPLEQSVVAPEKAPAEAASTELTGGVSSVGQAAIQPPITAAAAAAAGELGTYARRVQQAVAKNPPRPPRGTAGRGVVTITFALTPGGALAYARVQSSSGNAGLDEVALSAIRTTRFPAPPDGAQIYQLVYNFPVKFR